MPKVSEFYGVKVYLRWKDHNPPHFHVEYAGRAARIQIAPLQVLESSAPTRVISLALEWASLHQEELLECWALAQQHSKPLSIEPLE